MFKFKKNEKKVLADTLSPVSVYLKLRAHFSNPILLESTEFDGTDNSFSFICFEPLATFTVNDFKIEIQTPDGKIKRFDVSKENNVPNQLDQFINSFEVLADSQSKGDGIYGYATYDAVKYFETIELKAKKKEEYTIPDLNYSFYRYVLCYDHFKHQLYIAENLAEGESSKMYQIESLLNENTPAPNAFKIVGEEHSNFTDKEFKEIVAQGKKHCFRGDVFQIVLSRQFSQDFSGDNFNLYRALRSINPSPYLFYFDYSGYQIFGSSPEAQLIINNGRAYINPIAGTFRRTGNDNKDKKLAEKLMQDPKENAEHVMLVDLARNDLSRNTKEVSVVNYKEIHYYSHVLHMVSKVRGLLRENANASKIMADTFPAGTLSGAPKFKALELIDKYEKQSRSYYGGCIGYMSFKGDFNQAIMIRTFLSKGNKLFYQAGAGVVSESVEESEKDEVYNKLAALKNAMEMASKL